MEIFVSRKVDEFVPKSKWIVSLSNGETIFEDCRPSLPPAWKRLGEYLKENKLAITKMRVQFPPYGVNLPSNQKGYIQKKKLSSTGAWTKKEWVVGHVDENGSTLIHYIAEDRSSFSKYNEPDPGEPITIYDYREK